LALSPEQQEEHEVPKYAVGGSRPAGAYSPGIVAERRFVYVSGQGPFRDGVVTGESVGEQTRVALENLAAVLAEAGAGLSDVGTVNHEREIQYWLSRRRTDILVTDRPALAVAIRG
jgi:hypothetical protein